MIISLTPSESLLYNWNLCGSTTFFMEDIPGQNAPVLYITFNIKNEYITEFIAFYCS